MKHTKITWTENTWNPSSGCSPESAGCANCYAARMAGRFCKAGQPYEGLVQMTPLAHSRKMKARWTGRIHLAEDHLLDPLTWKKPTLVFVDSMSDLFHRDISTEYIRRVCDVMMRADRHIYQILTKRQERMRELLSTQEFTDVSQAKHIWWGVTAEDRRSGIARIETLRQTPVRNRFVSCEPMLGDMSDVDLTDIRWVIVGGESCGGREFRLEWARSMRDRCAEAGIPFLMKQLGLRPTEDGVRLRYLRADMYYRELSRFPADLRVQQFPESMTGHVTEAASTSTRSTKKKAGNTRAHALTSAEQRHNAALKAWDTRRANAAKTAQADNLAALSAPVWHDATEPAAYPGVPVDDFKRVMLWLSERSSTPGPMACMAQSAYAALNGIIQYLGEREAGRAA